MTAIAVAFSPSVVPLAAADQTGPDWVSSDNVEYIGSLKPDIGVTTGARIVVGAIERSR